MLGGWRQPFELDVSVVPTAETGGLQEEAEQGRGTEQRSDGMTCLCGSTVALIPGINMCDPLVSPRYVPGSCGEVRGGAASPGVCSGDAQNPGQLDSERKLDHCDHS